MGESYSFRRIRARIPRRVAYIRHWIVILEKKLREGDGGRRGDGNQDTRTAIFVSNAFKDNSYQIAFFIFLGIFVGGVNKTLRVLFFSLFTNSSSFSVIFICAIMTLISPFPCFFHPQPPQPPSLPGEGADTNPPPPSPDHHHSSRSTGFRSKYSQEIRLTKANRENVHEKKYARKRSNTI